MPWTRRAFLAASASSAALPALAAIPSPEAPVLVIDDLSEPGTTRLGTRWSAFTDQVMGGRSVVQAAAVSVDGRPALRMIADVSTANNGGFAQIAASLERAGRALDVSGYAALELDVYGNGEAYDVHLRTPDCRRPWQYYTQRFTAPAAWTTVRLPLSGFAPKALDAPLDRQQLLRIGLVAYGRDFRADLAVCRIAFVA